MESDERQARVLLALNILTGKISPPVQRVDREEEALLKFFREVRSHGYGTMEVVVFGHQIDTIRPGPTYKRKDFLK